jgi:hypothetical protein
MYSCKGNLQEEDVRLFLAAGADEVLGKPLKADVFESAYLRARVKRGLDF